MISVIPYGDTALLVNFEQRIDRRTHQQVLALHDSLGGTSGIRYMIPAYCSLTVVYDQQITSAAALHDIIESCDILPGTGHTGRGTEHHIIPVCYDDVFAPDLEEVSVQTSKSIEKIINAHLNTEFYVYMLGFMPGFAYMGDMPEEFRCRRKSTPRTRVPAGSVGLAGTQTAIYPFESPGGWQIIGRTSVTMFAPSRDVSPLVKAGDKIRFKRITRAQFDEFASE